MRLQITLLHCSIYAASQDALDGASVEGAHDGGRGSGSSDNMKSVNLLDNMKSGSERFLSAFQKLLL